MQKIYHLIAYGGPVGILAAYAGYGYTVPVAPALAILAMSWLARQAANRAQAHANMRKYIRNGGLNIPVSRNISISTGR